MKNYNYEEIATMLDEMMKIMTADYTSEQWSRKAEVDAIRVARVAELYDIVKDIIDASAFDAINEELWHKLVDETESTLRKASKYINQ